MFTLLSVMRRFFASGFRAGFILSFRWILSELKYSDKALLPVWEGIAAHLTLLSRPHMAVFILVCW